MNTFLSTNNINTLFTELKYFVKTQNQYDLNDKYLSQFETLCEVLYNKQKSFINSLEEFNTEVRSRIFPFIVNSILNRRKNKFNSSYIDNQLNCNNAAGNRMIPQNSSCIPSETEKYMGNLESRQLKGDNHCKEDSVTNQYQPINIKYDYLENQNKQMYNSLTNEDKITYNDTVVNDILNKYNSGSGASTTANPSGNSSTGTTNVTQPPSTESTTENFVNYDIEQNYFQTLNNESTTNTESSSSVLTNEQKALLNDKEKCDLNTENKNAPKLNSLIILDSKPLTADSSIKNINCELANSLSVKHVTDVTLEFLSLHNLKTENGLSIENCHNFVLTINADGFDINTYSNSPNLTGKYVLPNEAFGIQDLEEKDISFTGTGTTDHDASTDEAKKTITLTEANTNINSGMIVTGTGIATDTRVVSVSGTSVLLDKATTDTPETGQTFTFTFTSKTTGSTPNVYKSTIVKLKTNYMCTVGQYVDNINQDFSRFTFSLEGLVAGDENPSLLKAVNNSSRVQIGLFFKAR